MPVCCWFFLQFIYSLNLGVEFPEDGVGDARTFSTVLVQ